jgi:hypothetical protein
VNCFAKTTDQVGVLCVVAQYTLTAGSVAHTRVLYSTDWSSWACGGEIPGFDYLGTVYKSWTLKEKDPTIAVSNFGDGELTFDGTNIIIVAETMRDSSLAACGFNWSDDWGATWQGSAVTQQGGVGNVATGPKCARCLSTGTLIITWWKLTNTGTDDHIIGSTESLSLPLSTVTALTGTAATNERASKRGMFDVLADDTRAELYVDGTDTDIYIGGVLSDTILNDECRTIQGFSGDEDYIMVGRSWLNAEEASGGDSNVLYRSTDKGDNFSNQTGNLYTLGARSIVGVVFDWIQD